MMQRRWNRLCIIDDLLNHTHDTTCSGILLVSLKTWWRRWAGRLFSLHESRSFLCIKAFQYIEGCSEELLCGTLISNCHLELLVFLLAILASTLHLHLHLSDLALQCVNGLSQSLYGALQILNLCGKVLLRTRLLLGLQFVGVELINTEVLVLDFILLFFQELRNHVIDCLFHSGECVQTNTHGQCGKTGVLELLGNSGQELRSL